MPLIWPESTAKGTALLKLADQVQETVVLRDDYLQWFFDAAEVEALQAKPPDFERAQRTPDEEWERIEARLGSLPPRLFLIALDLTYDPLESLFDLGLDPRAPAICVWQGVSYYLSKESVSAVLDFVKRELPAETRFAFDAAGPLMLIPNERIPGIALNLERLAKIGEPYRFGITPSEMKDWLDEKGFRGIHVEEQAQLEERYLRKRTLPDEMWYVVTAQT